MDLMEKMLGFPPTDTEKFSLKDIPEYVEYQQIINMSDNDIINFSYIYDDKNMTLPKLEDKIIKMINSMTNPHLINILFKHHLDLFMENEKLFKYQFNSVAFELIEYNKKRQNANMIKRFFTELKSHYDLEQAGPFAGDTFITPTIKTSTSKRFSKMSFLSQSERSERSEDSDSSSFFSKYSKYPQKSIFNSVSPREFAQCIHKLYVYSYYMLETRNFQYQARHVNTTLDKFYAIYIKGIYQNFYRLMEKEIELFCEKNKLKYMIRIFDQMIDEFTLLHNIPFAKLVTIFLQNMKSCHPKNISKVLSKYNNLKQFDKYTYLVDPIAISRAFITSLELEDKIKAFNKIYDKLYKTRDELDNSITFTETPTQADHYVFAYLRPFELIENPLYTEYKETKEILCVRESCPKD